MSASVLDRGVKPFVVALGVISVPGALRVLQSKSSGSLPTKLRLALLKLLRPSSSNIKFALFPTLVPLLYQYIYRHLRPTVQYARYAAALSCSPFLLLLPQGLRVYLAVYVCSSALASFVRAPSTKAKQSPTLESSVDPHNVVKQDWRRFLPPVWTLNMIFNSWMVWSWFFEKGVFPRSYEKLILDHSSHYCPKDVRPYQLRDYFETTKYPLATSGSKHIFESCAMQHPGEPNCWVNYIKAWRKESAIAAKWVGGFGLLDTLISQRALVLKDPVRAFRQWFDYTIRGTAYVTGSVQTMWFMTCVTQRILPPHFLGRDRWIINGIVASFWIFALPQKRLQGISLYVARIGALSIWRAWKKRGGPSLKYGEVLVLALGWIGLLHLREEGWKVEGWLLSALRYVEGRSRRKKLEGKWTGKPRTDENEVENGPRPEGTDARSYLEQTEPHPELSDGA